MMIEKLRARLSNRSFGGSLARGLAAPLVSGCNGPTRSLEIAQQLKVRDDPDERTNLR
jgi:hypothetical protein